jgi:hypothetical protein
MSTADELCASAGRQAGAGAPARAEPLLRQAVALDPGQWGRRLRATGIGGHGQFSLAVVRS